MTRQDAASGTVGSSGRRGCVVTPAYLPEAENATVLAEVQRFRSVTELPVVAREGGERALRYQVIDGPTVAAHLPGLLALYQRVQHDLERAYRRRLVPLGDKRAALNVNITPPGGSYRWHYDRNAVTAVLYLNQVIGGELELCPGYCIAGRWLRPLPRRQEALDASLAPRPLRRVLGRPQLVAPAAGTLVSMRGDRCLHSVRPVAGAQDRVCVVMSYDPPGASSQRQLLNDYLYSSRSVGAADPNYHF